MTDAKIGTQYQFHVKAENATGVSEPSDASDAVTIYGKVCLWYLIAVKCIKRFMQFPFKNTS